MKNLDSAQSSSRSRLISLLPLLLLVVAGLGNAMFGAAVILPQWRAHEEAAAAVSAGKKTLQERNAPNAQQDTLRVLNGQIESARAKLEKAASTFWSETQIDGILDRLYSYAEASAVKVSSLQSVQQAQPIKNNVYDVRVFRLQVDGPIQDLMNFVARLREASLPSVIVSNFNIVKTESQHTLTMNVLIHTSPFASGEVFSNLPNVSAPTRVPPTATATATPTNTPTPTMTPTPSNTPTPLPATATPTITPTLSAAAAMPTSQCAGQTTQPMRRLIFSQMQDSTAACAIHVWNFSLDRTYPIVLDIQRRSGAERFRMELRDASNALLVFAPSSSDGRGILVAEVPAGNYTLNVVPLTASGNWAYTIALYSGLPSLSFSWMQSSNSSHSNAGAAPGVTRWRYTLSGAAQPYRVEANRTDGNFEFELTVLDSAEKPIGTAKSANGKASVALNTGAGTYTVQVTAQNGTSGSYQIGLAR